MAPKNKFVEGEKVLCFHGPLLYEAKCVKFQLKDKIIRYFVHYQGWNKSWDEWVPENRVLKFNDANILKQKELKEAHEASKNKKVRKGKLDDRADSPVPGLDEKPRGGKTSKAANALVESAREGKEGKEGGGPSKKKIKVDPNVESELEYTTKVEIRIKLPEELKNWLVDDWDLITRQKKLVELPVKVCVDQILDDYIKQKKGPKGKESALVEITNGIREYFNTMLGCQLLYKFERPQYQKMIKDGPEEKTMSKIYGLIHLLRLFVRLGPMLVYTSLDSKDIAILLTHVHDFLKFVSKNYTFSHAEYITATPEYHRKTVN